MKYNLIVGLIVLALVGRLIPHPDNFTPMLAVALFGGAMLPGRTAYLIPLVAVFLSDLLMGNAVTGMTPVIYVCFALGTGLGQWLGRNRTWARTGLAALGGGVLFYVATNFAVWITPNGLYPHTLDGLIQCYIMALPFFRNDIAGNVLWSATLFGLFDLGQLWIWTYRDKSLAH
jgi:uncharacterized protein DUF6580